MWCAIMRGACEVSAYMSMRGIPFSDALSKCILDDMLLWNACQSLVMGYSLGRVPRSECSNSQCSLAPDYGYKRWSTDKQAPHAYIEPDGIGYHEGTVFHGRSNFVMFWTKIWPAEQPNDTPNEQFLTYLGARWSVFCKCHSILQK